MRKRMIEAKKKFTTNTYMREAIDYDILIVKEDKLFITIKKYKKMKNKVNFSDEDIERTYIDEGYSIIEITPIDENYNIRYYVDRNKKIVDYYIDITLKNGVEKMIPYYVDLYLDIIHFPKNDIVKFVDEEELLDALNNKYISKKDYDFAYKIGNKLLKEIKEGTNMYLNMDIEKYLNMI